VLVAVDEAHCLSSWGHDFRPDYLTLGSTIAALAPTKGRRRGQRPVIVALTATASAPVREDIAARLRMRDPQVVVAGLDRPNLHLEATHCPTEEHRWRRLTAVLAESQGCGIVYVPTRRLAEDLARRLRESGYRAEHYHGGMAAGVRTRRHEEFLAGAVPVMVATSAFGMGIDKPDIRWVVHYALPDSPDSYLQEIGRAGRDGAPARAVLLFRAEDVALQRYFTGGTPALAEIRDLVAVLRERPHERAELRERSGFSMRKLTQLLTLLTEVDVVVVDPDGRLRSPESGPVPVEAARLALAEVERHQAVQRTRIDMMRQFAETRSCRGQSLLAYFGDSLDGPCGHCDNCLAGDPPAPEPVAVSNHDVRSVDPHPAPRSSAPAAHPGAPPVGGTVRHRTWGAGTVLGYEGDRMTVLFDSVGYKTLSVGVVREKDLLVVVAE
jgi:ATP-dependent DNA helicase RecQ